MCTLQEARSLPQVLADASRVGSRLLVGGCVPSRHHSQEWLPCGKTSEALSPSQARMCTVSLVQHSRAQAQEHGVSDACRGCWMEGPGPAGSAAAAAPAVAVQLDQRVQHCSQSSQARECTVSPVQHARPYRHAHCQVMQLARRLLIDKGLAVVWHARP